MDTVKTLAPRMFPAYVVARKGMTTPVVRIRQNVPIMSHKAISKDCLVWKKDELIQKIKAEQNISLESALNELAGR